ncbi:MAG: hypothetical protein L6R41_005256 [Letrouitia leprolyta]|nr:MAG: hypothetical protein L6R41_005256 [Letrouitia leprolyta]
MGKRKRQQDYHTKRMKSVQEGSNEQVLLADIRDLLQRTKDLSITKTQAFNDQGSDSTKVEEHSDAPERFSEVEVKISALSSIGDGLGFSSSSDHVYVVPFTLPGDVAKAKVVTHFAEDQYTLTDFVSISKPSPQRNDALVKCPYFAKCSGCQFQMLSYENQLAHKRTIVEKAYRNFSNLPPEMIPIIGNTIGSPMQYGYRTKITPHFDGPPGCMSRKARKNPSEQEGFKEVPSIGFMIKGTRKTMDIEDCPIATDAVKDGLRKERKRVHEQISKYKRGATLLLRETTKRTPVRGQSPAKDESRNDAKSPSPAQPTVQPADSPTNTANTNLNQPSPSTYTETKTYITDQNALSTEYIGPYTFLNPAGSFFQNNNSVLQTFTSYIRNRILPTPPSSSQKQNQKPITNLIDAYSGSGLFSISLSSLFETCLGIDIAPASITSARKNASLNNIKNATFVAADASSIFSQAGHLDPEETVVVIDPPRKGCDDGFLRQLLGWGPRRVVYVSCNVHTQARDVGVLVRGGREGWGEDGGKGHEGRDGAKVEEVDDGGKGKVRYRIESLRGFDFFPQTGHVEGVAILQRVDEEGGDEVVGKDE